MRRTPGAADGGPPRRRRHRRHLHQQQHLRQRVHHLPTLARVLQRREVLQQRRPAHRRPPRSEASCESEITPRRKSPPRLKRLPVVPAPRTLRPYCFMLCSADICARGGRSHDLSALDPLGRHRRYSPPRPWAPLSDDEWAVLAPFLHRAAEREAEQRREAEMRAAQHPDAPVLPARRSAGRPIRDPRARLDAVSGSPPTRGRARRPRPGRRSRPARQARHRLPPVPPLGQGKASGASSSKRWPTNTTPASRYCAAWKAGSAARTDAPGACSA